MDVIVIESNKEISQGSEILKLMASLAILLGSIYVFYTYSDLSVLIRALLIIFSVVISTLIFFTTHRGSIFLEFFARIKSRNEKSGLANQRRDFADGINSFHLCSDTWNIFLAVGFPAPIRNNIH